MRDLCQDCTKFNECMELENPPGYITLTIWWDERPTCPEFNELEITDPRIKRLSELFEFWGRCAVVDYLQENQKVIEPLFTLRDLVNQDFGKDTVIVLSIEGENNFLLDCIEKWLEVSVRCGTEPRLWKIGNLEAFWYRSFESAGSDCARLWNKISLRWECFEG